MGGMMKKKSLQTVAGTPAGTVSGYGPECFISPLTNEVIVCIPGIPEAVARLPHGSRDIIVTRNGALLYRKAAGGIAQAWCDQYDRVAEIVRALDTTCRSERGLPVTQVSAVSAVPPANPANSVKPVEPVSVVTVNSADIPATLRECAANMTDKKVDPEAWSRAIASVNRELEAKLEVIERYMRSLGLPVGEDRKTAAETGKRAPETGTAFFTASSGEVEWVQGGGLRDGLVAVSDNPFIHR